MDLSSVLKVLGPVVEPLLEQAVNQYWPQVDAAIAGISQPDEKLVLQALSPVLKGLVLQELKAHLA